MDEFNSLCKEALDLLKYIQTHPRSNTVSEQALYNSRMRYVNSIITKLKNMNGCTET